MRERADDANTADCLRKRQTSPSRSTTSFLAITGAELIGLTAIGRATVRLLQINCEEALTLRESLMAEGIF